MNSCFYCGWGKDATFIWKGNFACVHCYERFDSEITVKKLRELIKDLPDDMLVTTAYRGTSQKRQFGISTRAEVVYVRPSTKQTIHHVRPIYFTKDEISKDELRFNTYTEPVILLGDI